MFRLETGNLIPDTQYLKANTYRSHQVLLVWNLWKTKQKQNKRKKRHVAPKSERQAGSSQPFHFLSTIVVENTVNSVKNLLFFPPFYFDRGFHSPHWRKLNSENFTGISIDSVNNLDSMDYPQAAVENTKDFPQT